MKDHYDFTDAEIGKFYRPIETLQIPIYISQKNLEYLLDVAKKMDIPVSNLIDNILERDIELMKLVK